MIDVPLARPLNKDAVQTANTRLYQKYPSLKGQMLNPENPQYTQFMAIWREMYVEAGGPLKTSECCCTSENR